ncbi:MAG: glycosyltransferase family 9 protein, partial [Candidatus Omnitrophica bacterium]|nr:glycosyltransferase family 9 protein [Candidatus Omnitrophota bacterium]
MPVPKKILVVTPNWIGDVLFTFPFLAALKESYPAAEIICWTTPRCVEVLRNQPLIDGLLVYDERKERGVFSQWKFMISLRQKEIDAVFLLHRSMTRLLLCALAGIPKRIGYANQKQRWLLTDPLWPNHGAIGAGFKPAPTRQEWLQHGKHKVEYFLDLARFAGIKIHRPWYQFHLVEKTKKWAQEELSALGLKDKPFVVIQPGANWELKRWSAESFSKLLDYFIGEQIPVVVTGSQTDESLISRVVGRDRRGVYAFYGKNGLEELAAIFQRAALVVTNDTGPMHL